MKMKPLLTLNELDIKEVYNLAEEKRRTLGFVGKAPIANDIFTILDNLNIFLLEYPVRSNIEKPAFSAALIYASEGNSELVFLGLNTAHYYDRQIFAITHELYHYYTKTGSHLGRLAEDYSGSDITEQKANLFAAEFLLPEKILNNIILEEFKTSSLDKIEIKTLLRFIARLQCTWWLPYHSLVKRLKEVNAISNKQYTQLYKINERDMDGEYGRLGKAIDRDVFIKLNSTTDDIGTSAKNIEYIIRNFEDKLISEDKFYDALAIFNKSPEDFGFEIEIEYEDIADFDKFFTEEDDYED